jgi:hypothetical protein
MKERAKRKLEKYRAESLSSIAGDRLQVELMAQRPRTPGDPLDSILLEKVLAAIAAIEQRARTAERTDDLDDLEDDSELQALFAAYFCPEGETKHEGLLVIDQIEGWGVPKSAIKRLRDLFTGKLASKDRSEARSALYHLFAERDSWSDYTEEYEERMRSYTRLLFWTTISLLLAAVFALHFAPHFSPLLIVGLLFAGAAGSGVSVMAKMPALDVSLSGELDAYGRRILSRIAVGIIASLIGCGLLTWGVLPISIQNQTFKDAVEACAAPHALSSAGIPLLIALSLAMLLGFSERALASFEQRVFGEPKRYSTKQ